MLRDPITLGIATGATWLAVASSFIQIMLHLYNYNEPLYQRYILRIIFMVPFYGVTSWLSLMNREMTIYYDVPRDCYEAWMIYNFLSLCMAYVGGPGAIVVKSEGKYIEPSWYLMTCCWPAIKVDGFLLRKCKQGTLQFVLIKPILAALTLIFFALGNYEDGDWSLTGGYLYISLIYNVCYTVALYYLLLFYFGCSELLQPFHPLMKLILIKTVIFLTFWQSIAISMFSSRFTDPSDTGALQDWMVCIEMLMSAMMMWKGFPHTEYKVGGRASGFTIAAFVHALSLQDVYSDVMHQFNPNYKTYVLYTDGGPSENVKRKKFRKQSRRSTGKIHGAFKHPDEDEQKPRSIATADSDSEGEPWDGSVAASGGGRGMMNGMRKGLKWIPGISEAERDQAVLIESDSDAEYDEEAGMHDNQLDGTMLAAPRLDSETEQRTSKAGQTATSYRRNIMISNLKPAADIFRPFAQFATQLGEQYQSMGEESDDDDRLL